MRVTPNRLTPNMSIANGIDVPSLSFGFTRSDPEGVCSSFGSG
jgi:hypothetical protein